MIEPRIREQLSRDEGRRLTAYLDSEGYWTIGVGHLLDRIKNLPTPRISRITDDECDALLVRDIEIATHSCGKIFGFALAGLDAPRMRALVNMMFNRGETAVRNSSTITPAIRKAMDDGVWKPVHDAILASPWGVQIKDRAKRLAKQFLTGEDQ